MRGCADQDLRLPEDPENVRNRRVSIVVMFQEDAGKDRLDAPRLMRDLEQSLDEKRPPAGHPEPEEIETGALAAPDSSTSPRLESEVNEDVRRLMEQ
jgi:hypothetical protein